MKRRLTVMLALLFLVTIAFSQPGDFQIDTKSKGIHSIHFRSKCVGAGRANKGLRAGWPEQLQQVQEKVASGISGFMAFSTMTCSRSFRGRWSIVNSFTDAEQIFYSEKIIAQSKQRMQKNGIAQ